MVWRLLLAASLAAATTTLPVLARAEADDADEELTMSAFVGDWSRHGIFVQVADDGSARAIWRVYEWCGPGVPEPCDRIEGGSRLISGGRAELMLTPTAPDVAEGEVLVSNDPRLLEPGPVVLRLQPFGMAVLQNAGQEFVLCGPRYLDEAPAEVIDQSPCGA